MRTIPSLRGHRYLRTFGSFLIVIALIAVIASCVPTEKYELTMAVAPTAGGNATDETGTSPYAEGKVVDIKAVVAPCYRFASWTAPAGTFGNATAAETTFTMPARDVTVTANFELAPDHFRFYHVDWDTAPDPNKEVKLVDEFGTINTMVGKAGYFGNPVEKVHDDVVTPISDWNRHFTLYSLDVAQPTSWRVVVKNQFGDNQELTVAGPAGLLVPTQKEGQEEPVCLNHFLVYVVTDYETYPFVNVHLEDQFLSEDVTIGKPYFFANPVQKTVDGNVTEIMNEAEHLVLYAAQGEAFSKTVQIENQFGPQTIDVETSEVYPDMLAVPSEKISWEKPLDHFKVYPATGSSLNDEVLLVDQFVTLNTTVLDPWFFANPVTKFYNEQVTFPANWNHHLTFYDLSYEAPPEAQWNVEVDNQFGKGQKLVVSGPLYLAVPTQKYPLGMPVGLDHFLVYYVMQCDPFTADVGLTDQWTDSTRYVDFAMYFANPVQKTHGSTVTEIMNDEHLVFYYIQGGTYSTTGLQIANQFGDRLIDVNEDIAENLLGLPSEKVEWSVFTP
jgi:hypothetical protein